MPQPRKSARQATREAVAQASKVAEAREAAKSIAPPQRGRAGERDPFTGELRRREVLPLLVLHFVRLAAQLANREPFAEQSRYAEHHGGDDLDRLQDETVG